MSKYLSLLTSAGIHGAVFAALAYATTFVHPSETVTFGVRVGGGYPSVAWVSSVPAVEADEAEGDAPKAPKVEPAPEPPVAWQRFDVPSPEPESGARVDIQPAVDLRPSRPKDATHPFPPATQGPRTTSVASAGGPSGAAGDAGATDLTNPAPAYPAIARRRGYEGVVVIEFTVTAEGWATQPRVDASSGHACLDEAALDALRSWRFNPAMRDARPIASTQRVRFVFKLQ